MIFLHHCCEFEHKKYTVYVPVQTYTHTHTYLCTHTHIHNADESGDLDTHLMQDITCLL